MASGDTQLWLVCDVSGGMAENGKAMLVRAFIRTVEQYVRLGYASATLKLATWNDTVNVLDWNPDDEVPDAVLQVRGGCAAQPLLDLLGMDFGKALLLTDGWWNKETATALKRWRRDLPTDVLRVMKVGADANPLLKGEMVFSPEDFFAALAGWLPMTANRTEDAWA